MPLAKRRALFSARNLLRLFWFDFCLTDVFCWARCRLTISILIHRTVASKSGSHCPLENVRSHGETDVPSLLLWILKNCSISWLIDRSRNFESKPSPSNPASPEKICFTSGDRVETFLPKLHGGIDVTNRYAWEIDWGFGAPPFWTSSLCKPRRGSSIAIEAELFCIRSTACPAKGWEQNFGICPSTAAFVHSSGTDSDQWLFSPSKEEALSHRSLSV